MAHNILYVDDEEHNLEAFVRVFHDAEFVDEIFTALTPKEGLAILEEHEIAAVVTDQRMPGMSGTELLAHAIRINPDPVRLILTAYTDVKDIIDAINRGHVYYYITKPWEAETLKVIVRRALEHHDALQDLKRKNRELSLAYAHLEAVHREQERLYDMVIADEMTGVRNYHYFRIRMGEEFERARRYGKDLALVLVDIDDFGQVNDRFGREVGDSVLRELAELLHEGQRSIDVIARYGGEVFAILLPETDIGGAQAIAERLRQRITSHAFLGGGDRPFSLTVSCGIAAYPDADLTTREDLIQRADRGLFLAKTQGKNRTSAVGHGE